MALRRYVGAASMLVQAYARRVGRAQVTIVAASLAYFATFSLFPLLLLGVAGFGFALERDASFRDRVINFLTITVNTAFPTSGDMLIRTLGGLRGAVLTRLQGAAPISAVVGLIALLWAASGFFMVLQSALTLAVPGRRTRGIVAQRVVAVISIFTLGPLVVVLMLTGLVITSLADVPGLEAARQVSVSGLPLLGAYLLFSLAYRFLPAHNPGWRASLLGAAPAAVAWQLARSLLYFIMPKVTYAAYGALANFLLLLAWLYLSMEILLMGGVLTAMIERREYLPEELRLEKVVVAPNERVQDL